ncbi:MAG: asparagine synthase (glutamine-hydrolyzing) [Candidatus Rokubacteria bacterium]|nr:asparagine synthase (glutamine-hydrolyzing) [Candidatus Rokubacteria bacterium]
MCGIAGIFRLTGSVSAEDIGAVLRMMDAQVHRGPDDWGLLVPEVASADSEVRLLLEHLDPDHIRTYAAVPGAPPVVLCSRRLSIIDRSPRGRMPMGGDDGRRWVAHNGEIYNHRELRAELGGAATFRSATDTEVLLRGWDAWGDGVAERLRGMFAFALFEASPRPRLLLGRDRFGIKPLYSYEDRTRVVFASEIRAVVTSGLVPDETSPEALGRFLELGSVPAPLTTVKDVRALPAGHVAHVDADGLRLTRYWSLDAAVEAARPPSPPSRAEAVASTRALLDETVGLHLVSDAPLGVFLSGGVDSAGLVALAVAGRERPLTTLTVAFDEAELSEARYARLVADRYGTDHREIVVRSGSVFDELPRFFAAMDQPTVDGLNTWCVSRAAREAGLSVVLSGLGGDEVFWGYCHLRSVAALAGARRVMAALPRPARRGLARLAAACAGLGRPGLDRAAYLEAPSAAGVYLLIRGLFTEVQARGLLGLEAGGLGNARAALPPEAAHGLREALTRFDISHYLGNQLLRDTDVMSMAHSVETRVPYLDHRLVQHVLALPASMKLDGARPKPLLLDALADRLPRAVWDRPKMGFTFPMDRWMRARAGDLRALCLESKRLERRSVEDVWDAFARRRAHWSRPWALVTLARFEAARRGRVAA